MPAVMMTKRGWKGIAYDYLSILFDCLVHLKMSKMIYRNFWGDHLNLKKCQKWFLKSEQLMFTITWRATWCLRLLMLSPCINLKSLFGCNKQKSELFFLIFLLWSRSTACNNFKALCSCHICLGGIYINDFEFFIIPKLFDHYQSATFALKVGMISSSQDLWEKHLCLKVHIHRRLQRQGHPLNPYWRRNGEK